MRETETRGRFGWGYLILGILFVIASLIAFFNPVASLEGFVVAFAILAIVDGILMIAYRDGSGLRVVGGIFDILIGIFLLLNLTLAITTLPYIFAIWFIADSIFRLLTLGTVRDTAGWGMFWFSLIINIIGIAVGIMLLFQPVVSLLTMSFLIGFYLMMIGVLFVVAAFARTSSTDTAIVYTQTGDNYDEF